MRLLSLSSPFNRNSHRQLNLHDDDTLLDDNNEQSQKNQEKEAEYRTCKNELEIQKKLNKELQQRLRELMSESKLLKCENERVMKLADSCKEQSNELKQNLTQESKRSKQIEIELKTHQRKLSEATAQSLVMEEENSKLKNNLDKMSKDKTSLVDQMMKTSTGCDLIETKLETEIQDLKDVHLKEIQEVRNQVEKSMLITRPASTIESAPSVQQVPSNTGSTLRLTHSRTTGRESVKQQMLKIEPKINKQLKASKQHLLLGIH